MADPIWLTCFSISMNVKVVFYFVNILGRFFYFLPNVIFLKKKIENIDFIKNIIYLLHIYLQYFVVFEYRTVRMSFCSYVSII